MDRPRRPRGPRQEDVEFVPTKRTRGQRAVDMFGSAIRHRANRPYTTQPYAAHVPPHEYYGKDLVPASRTPYMPAAALCTQWVHTANYPDASQRFGGPPRRRGYFTTMVFSTSGRKILAAVSNGEFVVYNGHSFGVEHKTTAHEDNKPIKALAWGPVSDAVLSGDEGGTVKLWGANFHLAAEFDSNQRAVRAVDWAPSERKFCTAGQDGSARIWDAERVAGAAGNPDVETKLEGHGGDVQAVRWHPSRALLATGSQDRHCRLWDPRKGVDNTLAVLGAHDEPITSVAWHPGGHDWLIATGGRDSTARVWDTRMLKELHRFVGHTGDVNGVAWHPTNPTLLATCGADGLLAFWNTTQSTHDVTKWSAAVHRAHDQVRDKPNSITCLAWSPLGHILATAAGEVNIWARNKPGAVEEIRYETEDAADIVVPASAPGVANFS